MPLRLRLDGFGLGLKGFSFGEGWLISLGGGGSSMGCILLGEISHLFVRFEEVGGVVEEG